MPFLLFLGVFSLHSAVLASQGEDIIRQVQARFESLTTLSAYLETSFQGAGSGGVQREVGRIFLQGENRFRTQTTQRTIVTDGKTLWMYSVIQQQVIIRNVADGMEDLITPQRLLYEYPQRYRVVAVEQDSLEGISCDVLVMEPLSDTDPTKYLKVWVDREDRLTRKFLIEDLADNVTTFEFEQFELGIDLPEDTFHFIPPEGTEIIDLR